MKDKPSSVCNPAQPELFHRSVYENIVSGGAEITREVTAAEGECSENFYCKNLKINFLRDRTRNLIYNGIWRDSAI